MGISRMKKIVLLLFAALIVYTAFFTEKARLDREVNRLCEIDGGIRVYEKVKLTGNLLLNDGNIAIPYKKDISPGDKYFLDYSLNYIREGNPELYRLHIKAYRLSDHKLLGEVISYSRRGGDLPGPWHESFFRCPAKTEIDMNKQIFVEN